MSDISEVPVELREVNGEIMLVLQNGAASAIADLRDKGDLVLQRTEQGYCLRVRETPAERQLRIGKEIMERYRNVLAALAK
jgi:hypothetical protein